MVSKLKFIFISVLLLCTDLKGQELGILGAGVSAGIMNYKGDLDDNLSMKFLRPGFGLHVNAIPWQKIVLSFNYLHGSIECDDAKANISRNKYRNLNFYSEIDELSVMVIYRFHRRMHSFRVRSDYTPYLFAGIAYFHFNPKSKLNGNVYELQKIGTEGQMLSEGSEMYPEPYSLWQFSIPFGAGVKRRVSSLIDLGFEIGLRKTFTDYLDDVSGKYPDKNQLRIEEGDAAVYLSDPSNDPARPQGRKSFADRGHSDKKDWYIYTNFSITYYFATKLYVSRPTF